MSLFPKTSAFDQERERLERLFVPAPNQVQAADQQKLTEKVAAEKESAQVAHYGSALGRIREWIDYHSELPVDDYRAISSFLDDVGL